MQGTVLIADDDRTIRTVLTQALSRAGCRVHSTGSLVMLKRWVEEGRGDLVISDVVMPDGNGLQAMPEISRLRPDLPVIIISAQNNIMTAIQATEAEAFDYLPKPFDLPDLMKRVNLGLKQKHTCTPPPQATPEEQTLPLVGHSPLMQDLYRLIARVMNTDMAVLIQGESGTGKSLIARVLHDFSERREHPFVIANVEALASPEQTRDLFHRAGQGSLLFDEVSELNTEDQIRLTRLLDGRSSDGPRIISTSQQDLRQNDFRDDLYFRLSGITIEVPRLRDRPDDISELAAHFLAQSSPASGPASTQPRSPSKGAAERLRAYGWPGNIRQLKNTMHRLNATALAPLISAEEVAAILGDAPAHGPDRNGPNEGISSTVAAHIMRYFALHGDSLPPPGLYDRVLREIELPLLEIAMDATGGNQAKCSDLLGMNRNTLRKKLTALGIEVTRRRRLM